jgi:FSR family fosmidomycin resistance protein-like MFS transporter
VLTVTSSFQFLAGYFVDKLGWKKLTFFGMLLNAIVLFTYGFSPTFLVFLFLIFIAGISSTTFHPATYSLIAMKSSEEHLTKSMAIHQFGGFFGGAIGTALVAFLSTYFGWRGTLHITALIGLPFIILFLFGVKEEKTPISTEIIELEVEETKVDKNSLLSRAFIVILLASFLGSLGGGARSFLPTFLSTKFGESVFIAGILTSMTQVIGSVSLVLGGILADRFNKASIASISYIGTALFTIIISLSLFPSNFLIPVLLLLGFAQYFGGPAMHALTQSVSKESARGRATGLEFSFLALGGVGASLLTGYLTDTFNMTYAFLASSLFIFFAGITILILKNEII